MNNPKTSSNNKLEITITSTSNIINNESLKKFLTKNQCGNIKKLKVLKDRKKAYVTFNDRKSYETAINLYPYGITIIPTNINIATVYKKQQLIDDKLDYLMHLAHDMRDYLEFECERLEIELKTSLLAICEEMGLNTEKIAGAMDLEEDDQASKFEKDQEPSFLLDKSSRTIFKRRKSF